MKHFIALALYMSFFWLTGATPAQAESIFGPFAPKAPPDHQRVADMLALAEDVIAYKQKTGHYPLAGNEPQAQMTVVGITGYFPEGDNPTFTAKKKLEDALKETLGKGVELRLDPVEGQEGVELRIYQYATDGQDYYVSAYLEESTPYTREIKTGHHMLEITSRPLKRDSQYSVKQIKRFLKYGPDDAVKQGALEKAIDARDFDAAKKAIEDGANLDPVCDFDTVCKPLAKAAHEGDMEMIKFLLDNGADINGFSAYDETPLIYAIGNGQQEAAKYLVEAGGDVNLSSSFGATPFIGAVSSGDIELATLMLKKGADVNRHYLELNSNATAGDTADRPLEGAIKSGRPELVALLLKSGADVSLKGEGGMTMLDAAKAKGDKKIIALIEAAQKK